MKTNYRKKVNSEEYNHKIICTLFPLSEGSVIFKGIPGTALPQRCTTISIIVLDSFFSSRFEGPVRVLLFLFISPE